MTTTKTSYKDSGIAWIGQIPEGWKIKKIKYLGRLIAGGTPKTDIKEYWGGNIPWIPSGMIHDCIIKNNEGGKYITEKGLIESATKEIPANSPLVALTGATCANVALLKFKATANQSVIGLAVDLYNYPEFLYYSFLANREQFLFHQTGGAQGGINLDDVKNIFLTLPPLPAQTTIANYLDTKTTQINEFITKKKQLISLLQEQKQAIIHQAVTKGIDPSAKVKDSGIAWIGEIPEGWEVRKMKYVLTINNGSDFKHIETETGFPVVGSGGQFAYASEYMYDGEVVFLGRKGTIDKPLYFKGKFWAVDTMFYAIAKDGNNARFLYFVSLTIPFNLYSTSTALPSMTQSDLNNHRIAFPKIKEQQQIVSYIESRTSKVDQAIAKMEQEIDLIQEYRSSLIYHAVTGKIDIQ